MGNNHNNQPLRIACIGIRSIPPRAGSAGADTNAMEVHKRLVKLGHRVICYNRLYKNDQILYNKYCNIDLVYLKTINTTGFDSIIHTAKATFHIIIHNTADIVMIGNGGNSIWGLFLRFFGKKVIVLQDGIDWKRDRFPWYGKLFLFISTYITSSVPHHVIFDNPFTKEVFEKKFNKPFHFVKTGVDISEYQESPEILEKLKLIAGEYLLFVGRFIPDKGLHYLIPAFKEIVTSKKLVLVGGSPTPSDYEKMITSMAGDRIIFPGYIYGNDMLNLIKNAYLYIQPSDVEGLSPVMLKVMAMGTPLLCSDIEENMFVVRDMALTFTKSSIIDLREKIKFALNHPEAIKQYAVKAEDVISEEYSWEKAIEKYISIFTSE